MNKLTFTMGFVISEFDCTGSTYYFVNSFRKSNFQAPSAKEDKELHIDTIIFSRKLFCL